MQNTTEYPLTWTWQRRSVDDVWGMAALGAVVLCGGRGIGKTAVLSMVTSRFRNLGSPQIYSINCRNRSAALLEISEFSEGIRDSEIQMVVIDNVDIAFTPRPGDSVDIQQRAARGLGDLVNWRQERGKENRRLILGSTINFGGPRSERISDFTKGGALDLSSIVPTAPLIQIISDTLRPIAHYKLNPWIGDWKSSWIDDFGSQLGAMTPGAIKLWSASLIDATGGHPALYMPVVTKLKELTVGEPSEFERTLLGLAETSKSYETLLPNRITFYMEDLLVPTGIATIRNSIRNLKDSQDELERRAFNALVRHVQPGENIDTAPLGVDRAILMEEGLLYPDSINGNYVVPGSLIRDQVLQTSGVSIDVQANPTSDAAGTLTVGSKKIELKGNTWRVLDFLSQKQGEFVSLESMPQELDARNSIQRLREMLKRNGYSHLIENVYGRGYRLISN